jgi:hypothetical protein
VVDRQLGRGQGREAETMADHSPRSRRQRAVDQKEREVAQLGRDLAAVEQVTLALIQDRRSPP